MLNLLAYLLNRLAIQTLLQIARQQTWAFE